MNLLIADDEEEFRSLLREVFSADPTIHVASAANAMEAWWFLSDPDPAHRFDLGIFDLNMPGENGFSLLTRVRKCAKYRHLPVIMCSGVNDRETILQSSELAASYYLIKPFKIEALVAKVHELANGRRAAQTASRSPLSKRYSPRIATA